jgi:hypothetical protein
LVFDGGGAAELYWGKHWSILGFGFGGVNIGGEAVSEGGQGPHTTPRRGQGGGATPWCGGSLAPLRLSFGLRLVSGKK